MSEGSQVPVACDLDHAGAREQGDRYQRLSRQAAAVSRSGTALTVRFSREVDDGLLAEAIAVERDCCPFLAIDYDSGARSLSIRSTQPHGSPALDAIETALRGARA